MHLLLSAGRAVCLTENVAQPMVFLSAVSIMRSYGFAKTARSRNVNRIRKYDLTASSLPDVVPISVLPENKTFHAAPALQDAVGAYLLPVDLKME